MASTVPPGITPDQLKKVSRPGTIPNAPLPPGWSWKLDARTGKVYFMNHLRKATVWEDPRPLPYGWSTKTDATTQKVYFLDHNTKSTTWNDPRPFPPLVNEHSEALAASRPRGSSGAALGMPPSIGPPPSSSSPPPSSVGSGSACTGSAAGGSSVSASSVSSSTKVEEKLAYPERSAWIDQITQMGFERSKVVKGCNVKKNKSIELLVNWLMSGGDTQKEEVEVEDPISMLRKLFTADLQNGLPLTTEQYNVIYLTSHGPESKYNCAVCFDDELEINGIFVLSTCHHYLCIGCMSQHIITLNRSMRSSVLNCPFPECKTSINYAEVKRCLTREDFDKYQQFLLQDTLSKVGECRWCPNPGCGTAMIGDPSIPLMRCPKPDCRFSFCFNCKEKWHTDLTCEQYQQWKKENSAGDARFVEWAAKNTKPCAKCKVAIQKNEGCNHMTCTNCRYQFCWLCMQSVLGPDGKYKPGHWALDDKSPCYNRMHT